MIVVPQPPLLQEHMVLPDGRRLAWSQWGPAHGRPVIFCTGAGMSGSFGFAEAALDELFVRLIGIDRPGLGRSDGDAHGDLTSWAADIAMLIEHLELRQPLAVGFSQGAPYALQLAAMKAVTGAAVVSGQDDFGSPTIRSLLPAPVTQMINELNSNRHEFEKKIVQSASADWLWTMIMQMSSEADRRIFGSEAFAASYRLSLNEGFGQGSLGYARSLSNTWSAWPFRLENLSVPVDIWYGHFDESPVHSPDLGETMSARIPKARRFVQEGHGSAILWTRGAKILTELLKH